VESASRDRISFVLVAPTEPGNIGAAARALMNFGFRRLELVAPVPFKTQEAWAMACQARDVLEKAKVHRSLRPALADKVLVVGTTRRLGSKRGLILDVREAVGRIARAARSGGVAILFGNEHSGLTNQELNECGLVLTIPSSPDFPSLNLAQSVMIVAYELAGVGGKSRPLPLVENRELGKLFRRLPKTLKALAYTRTGDKDLPEEITRHLKRLFGRSGLTEWELNMLLGLCTQVEKGRTHKPGTGQREKRTRS